MYLLFEQFLLLLIQHVFFIRLKFRELKFCLLEPSGVAEKVPLASAGHMAHASIC